MSDLGVIWRVPPLERMILQQGGLSLAGLESVPLSRNPCDTESPAQGTASGQGQVLGAGGEAGSWYVCREEGAVAVHCQRPALLPWGQGGTWGWEPEEGMGWDGMTHRAGSLRKGWDDTGLGAWGGDRGDTQS